MITSSFQSDFDRSVLALARVLSAGRSEPICLAYIQLRQHAAGMTIAEMLSRLQQALGQENLAAIFSAFSHRHCYMCVDGHVPCHSCEGSGQLGDGPCLQCAGLGMEGCNFCSGTGWGDESLMPRELIPELRKRHLSHALGQWKKLTEAGDLAKWALNAGRMPMAERREVALWVMRVKARLEAVAEEHVVHEPAQIQQLQKMAHHVEKVLRLLCPRERAAPKAPEAEDAASNL